MLHLVLVVFCPLRLHHFQTEFPCLLIHLMHHSPGIITDCLLEPSFLQVLMS